MDPLEKLKQEEAELEAQMLGNQTEDPQQPEEPEVSATADTGIERTEEELAADEYMMDAITGDPEQSEYLEEPYEPEPQPQKPKRTNWKKRFTNYKSSTDLTINELRTDLINLQSHVESLRAENQELRSAKQEVQGDLFEGAFTQEDEDTFGSDGLDVVKKAAKVAIERQVEPLKQELKRHEETRVRELAQRAEAQKRTEYNAFLQRLESLVPEYAELNVNPEFLNWLSEPDEASGFPKVELFRRAERSRDVGRVAEFFRSYLGEAQAAIREAGRIPRDMERHITPVGSGGGAPAPKKQSDPGYYRQSDIDKFYSDVMKGRYEGQQDVIIATERAIEEAAMNGRILKGQ